MPKLTFKFKLKLVNGMRPTTVRVNNSYLRDDELADTESPTEPNVYEGEIIATTFLDTVSFSVYGVGTPFLAGTCNLSFNGKNMFDKDQPLKVLEGARFRFYKEKVQIP